MEKSQDYIYKKSCGQDFLSRTALWLNCYKNLTCNRYRELDFLHRMCDNMLRTAVHAVSDTFRL